MQCYVNRRVNLPAEKTLGIVFIITSWLAQSIPKSTVDQNWLPHKLLKFPSDHSRIIFWKSFEDRHKQVISLFLGKYSPGLKLVVARAKIPEILGQVRPSLALALATQKP